MTADSGNTGSGSDPGERRFLGVPYDFRRPTAARFRQRWWNDDDPRILVPRAWGWGWDVNLKAIPKRVRRSR